MGKPDPAAEFCAELYPRLIRFLYVRTGAGPQDLDDLAQDVLLRAWHGGKAFRGAASLSTWVFSIAKCAAADYCRARRRSRERQKAVDAALRDLDRVPLPEAILDTEEMRRRVAEALSRIGKDHSDVLILRYFHGLGVGEIAARRGLSREAVESRLVRAREALHEFLGGHACAALFLSETSSS